MEPIYTSRGLVGWLDGSFVRDRRLAARAFIVNDFVFDFRGGGYRGFIRDRLIRDPASRPVAFLQNAQMGSRPPIPPVPDVPPKPPTPPTPAAPAIPPTPPTPKGFAAAIGWDTFLG